MIIRIQVKPGRKQESIDVLGDLLLLKVKAPAREGLANERVEEVIAQSAGIAKSSVKIIKGQTSSHKTVSIDITESAFLIWKTSLETKPG